MRLAIVGSRAFDDYAMLCNVVDELIPPGVTPTIISGGAMGADSLAERYAADHGYQMVVYHANWLVYGKAAGYKRNVNIVGDSTHVVAFWDGMSPGTKHTIDIANAAKKVLLVIPYLEPKSGLDV